MCKSKKNILFVETTGEVGGAEISLLNLLRYIDRYKAFVVIPKKGPLLTRLMSMKIPVYILPLPQGSRANSIPWAWSVFKLAILCRRLRINLVHSNHEFANRHVSISARLSGIKQICHVRNIQTIHSFRHYWLGLAPLLVANSKATERSYHKYMKAGQRSFVVYNGVDLSIFDGIRRSKINYGFSEDSFVVAQIGRVVRDKGFHLFLEAFLKVAPIRPEVIGVIVGDTSVDGETEYYRQLKKMINEHNLQERFLFLKHVQNIPDFLGSIDLLVHPSRSEGFGRILCESMAMRTPVIATDVDAIPEIVENGISGLLIPWGDAMALANAIVQVIENPQLYGKLAKNARLRMEEHFSQERQVMQIQELYDQLLIQFHN